MILSGGFQACEMIGRSAVDNCAFYPSDKGLWAVESVRAEIWLIYILLNKLCTPVWRGSAQRQGLLFIIHSRDSVLL